MYRTTNVNVTEKKKVTSEGKLLQIGRKVFKSVIYLLGETENNISDSLQLTCSKIETGSKRNQLVGGRGIER